ncbi:Gag-Pol polyprotein [Araneus ventricosus]|uniref:Gag-Pol polyprotein n=1 Tax=Araneus ventricosus TaxID=182803 RepID=A0A4Y2VIR4_ARAVE|nr:Gag-Pol polyprotein [Araneus ventricosus]
MSDYFTRYAEAYALPNIQSSNVARVLIDFISRHGIMQVLYSDRGSNFLSQAMQEVYNKLGISKQQTLSYSPQGNGLVERLNKTLIDSLSHLVSENQEDWCEHLPFALMAFRNACHSTTNESPNFLVYGRDPVMPYHLIYSEKIRSYSDNPSYAQQLVTKLQSAFNVVKQNLEKQADKYEKMKVSLPKNKKIEIGDLVYLHTPRIKIHTSKKLAKLNQGPFRVINKSSPVIFEIQEVNKPANKQKVHLNRLIKVLEREIFPTLESSSDTIDSPAVDAQIDPISDPSNDFVEEYPPPLALPYTDMGDDGQNFVNVLTQSSCVNQNQTRNTTNYQDEIISDIVDDQNSDDFATYSPVAASNQNTSISNSQCLSPVLVGNHTATVSQTQIQNNTQKSYPYNLRPRNIFGFVRYN